MSSFPRRRAWSGRAPRARAARAWPWVAAGVVALAGGAGQGCGRGPEAPPAASKPPAPLSMEDEKALESLQQRKAELEKRIAAWRQEVEVLNRELKALIAALRGEGAQSPDKVPAVMDKAGSISRRMRAIQEAEALRESYDRMIRDVEKRRDEKQVGALLEALKPAEEDAAVLHAIKARVESNEDFIEAFARDEAAREVVSEFGALGEFALPSHPGLDATVAEDVKSLIQKAREAENKGLFEDALAAYQSAKAQLREQPEPVRRALDARVEELAGVRLYAAQAKKARIAETEEARLQDLVAKADAQPALWGEAVDVARSILSEVDSRRTYAVSVLHRALDASTRGIAPDARAAAAEALTWRGRPTGSRASAMAAAAEAREACARLDLRGATAALDLVAKANPDWPMLADLQARVAGLRSDTAEVEAMVEALRAPRASVEELRAAVDKAGRWLVARPEWSVRLAPAVGEAERRLDADAAARKAEGERWALRAKAARDAADAETLLAEHDSLPDAAREATRKERERLVSLVAEAKRMAETSAAEAAAAEERRRAQEEARARAEEKRKADAKAGVEAKLRQAQEQVRKGDDTRRKTGDRIAAFKRAIDLYEDVKGNDSAEREARAQACFWCALLNKRLFDAYDGARPRSPVYYEAAKAHRASAIRHRDDLERLYPDVVDPRSQETYAVALRRVFAE